MSNPTQVPSVDTSQNSSNSSDFDFEKFSKVYNLLNSKNSNNSTSGLSAFGDALSGIASAYMASNGFNFDKTPSANTNKPTI